MRGAPGCDGVELFYVTDEVEQRLMFERGELDILDLDKLGDEAEYCIHGDIYRDRLHTAQQVDISYIALNQAVKPLDDVRVRTALQMSLDRQMILDALYSGRGTVENGIFPHGLTGYNPDLEPIPYDPEAAATLLAEAADRFSAGDYEAELDYRGDDEVGFPGQGHCGLHSRSGYGRGAGARPGGPADVRGKTALQGNDRGSMISGRQQRGQSFTDCPP